MQRGTQNIFILKVTNKNKFPTLRLHQGNIKEVDKFVYLGSVVSQRYGYLKVKLVREKEKDSTTESMQN